MMPMIGVVIVTVRMLVAVERAGVRSWAGSAWVAIALVQCGYVLLQAALWLRYRPFATPAEGTLPSLTVIIPAYNEGPMIERSIRSVAEADYDAAALEIIVVDDGSRDDTYFHMEHLRRRYPSLVRILRFAGNRGKRAGLHAAMRAARGEIIATLDSDSEIERGTLRALVAPFADAHVGGVAGRVAVLNRDTLIGRMLAVQFALAFDFGRAAQSAYRAVACCPGALSAFRRAVILPHLDDWLDQRFLGRPVSHGEDQALTNIVLRAGYDTVYQGTAVVHTLTPSRYRQLARMLTRWDRSFIVEGFAFARFMFTRYRPRNRLLPIIGFVMTNLRLVLLYVGLALVPSFVAEHPQLLPHYVVATALASLFPALYYLRTERSLTFLYGVVYAFYSLLFLQWTLPWALLTVRDERWGTR